MRIIWTPRAASDLETAINYICGGIPDAISGVSSKLYNHVLMLSAMPLMGGTGTLPGTRELVFNPYPFIAVY